MSMYRTSNPHADAERWETDRQAEYDAYARDYEEITEKITKLYEELLTKAPIENLIAPCVVGVGSQWGGTPMKDAIGESITYYDDIFNQLIVVLTKSNCEHVAQLRSTLAQNWVDRHAADLAGLPPQ